MEPTPPPALEDLYDEDILARIDRQLGSGAAPWPAPGPGGGGDEVHHAAETPADRPADATVGAPDDEADGGRSGAPTAGPAPAAAAVMTAGSDGVVPRYPVARRLGVGGAMLAGAMFGLGEALEPDRARQHIIDYVPDDIDESRQPVTFHYV